MQSWLQHDVPRRYAVYAIPRTPGADPDIPPAWAIIDTSLPAGLPDILAHERMLALTYDYDRARELCGRLNYLEGLISRPHPQGWQWAAYADDIAPRGEGLDGEGEGEQ